MLDEFGQQCFLSAKHLKGLWKPTPSMSPAKQTRKEKRNDPNLQSSGENLVLPAGEEHRHDPGIVEFQYSIVELRGGSRVPIAEKDSHLPHKEATSGTLEGIPGHEGHGGLQAAWLCGQGRLEVLDLLEEARFLPGVSKADLCGDLVVVGDQSHPGTPRTVALSDG